MSLTEYYRHLRELNEHWAKIRSANIATANRRDTIIADLKAEDRANAEIAAREEYRRTKIPRPEIWDAHSLISFDHLRFGYLLKRRR